MKRMDQLEAAWQQEAEAKARRFIMSRFSRKQRFWLPIFENFGAREMAESEKQYKRIVPRAARKVRRIDIESWVRKVSENLEKARGQRQ